MAQPWSGGLCSRPERRPEIRPGLPDAQYIAYGQIILIGTPSIYVLNTATGEERRLTSDSGRFPSSPVWSPDGSRIVFADASVRGDDARLVSIPAAGGALSILTVTVTRAYPSSWRS